MVPNAESLSKASKAILTNNLVALKELVESGFPVDDLVFHKNSNLLLMATEQRKPQIIKYLLEAGANPNCKNDQFGDTALHTACREGDLAAVELLTGKADLDVTNDAGMRPIISAIKAKNGLKIVKALHAAGASLATHGKFGLLHAAAQQADPEVIDFLVAHGCDPNELVTGATPLMVAVRQYDVARVYPSRKGARSTACPQIVQRLLDHGADPQAVYSSNQSVEKGMDTTGKTILQYAQEVGLQSSLIKLLNAAGSPTKRARQGSAVKASKQGRDAGHPTSVGDLIRAIAKHHKPLSKSLRPGAGKKLLDLLEAEAQEDLPDQFKELWSAFNGQRPSCQGLFPATVFEREYRLLSIDEIITQWYAWYDLMMSGEFEGESVSTDGKVRRTWYHERWMPVAGDGAGNFLCLDLSPTAKGSVGQVILLDHEEADRRVVAFSLLQALKSILESDH